MPSDLNMFDKWQQNPIISTIKETAPFDIPHPAITICPQVKVNRKYMEVNNVYSELHKMFFGKTYNTTVKEIKRFVAFAQICDRSIYFIMNSTLASNQIVPTLQHISPNRGEVLYFCQFKITWDDWQECKEYFTEIMTGEGNCFTLNMLNSSEIFRDNV